ncbi:MAG: UDP-N-acetylmuramoyl-L-alanine--D-glutamate ligase [Deltaproteobacteria bacterium]|nr:UDP-N-acetylmuramoyl-L-alanine--D-glutamate ligase [Deltaproteobacteria bacterium]
MEFQGKKILVVGLGKTGMAMVSFFLKEGAQVMISDSREISELKEMVSSFDRSDPPLLLEGEGHSPEFFLKSDMVGVSPGIPLDLPALKAVREKGTPVFGEVEIFADRSLTPVVAVTGTNGKTTTTALLNEMLVNSGKKTFLGGNIGRPLMDFILGGQDQEIVVAEISSFQLDTTTRFSPRVGLLLNITEDHLDRYSDFQAYAASKASLFRNQGEGDAAVVNWDDPICRSIGEKLSGPVYFFSRTRKISPGAYLEKKQALVFWGEHQETYDLSEFALPGMHNRENALAAILGARLMGADRAAVQKTLESFRGFGHRLEYVGEVNGVRFYDDSKATNVGAVFKALEGFNEPIILIAGGRDKGGDYYPLQKLIQQKVRILILIGEAREIMRKQLGGLTKTEFTDTLEEAVQRAFDQSRPGEVVLLSPACSSFDMFRDYAQRGNVFQKAVKELGKVKP